MTTPTPDDRRVAEWAKNQLMETGVEDPTTPIVITTKHTSSGSRTVISGLDVLMARMQRLERERDEARAALSTALRERESARQAISMADGTLVQIVAERDAWKAKAERTCGISEIPDWKGLFYLMTNCGGHVTGRSDWCPHCGGRIVKEEKP